VYLKRCNTRYAYKLADTIAKGRAPNMRSNAANYRDSDPELAWRASCLWVEALPTVKSRCSGERALQLETMFFQGLLDASMMDKCRALDASFDFDDLRFVREELLQSTLASGASQADTLDRATRQKLLADYALLEAELESEQLVWQSYLTRLAEAQDADLSSRIALKEKHADALLLAVAEHQESSYRTISLPAHSGAPAFLASALSAFAGLPPARPADQIWRLNVVNCCCLGVQASVVLQKVAENLSSEHAHHPERTMSIVVLPNMPAWGHGPRPHDCVRWHVVAAATQGGCTV